METTASQAPASILLVDDREENLDSLEAILRDLGQNLVRATSGSEALRQLLYQDFALIILDVKMPDMSGLEAAAMIRARERTRHTPIIFVTAYDYQDEKVAQGYALGAVDFLFKPIVPVVLRSKVSVFVDLYLRRAETRLQAERLQEAERRAHEREMEDAKRRWEAERLREEMERERQMARELQESYRRLKRMESQKDDLMHMIVHDLRQPLTSMMFGLHTLQSSAELTAPDREIVEITLEGGDTLLGMINELLDIGKMEDGSLRLERAPVDARTVVEQAASQVAGLARQKGLQPQITTSEDLPTVVGDPDLLRRTLVNLLGNAIKFTPPGGQISCDVRWEPAEQAVFFVVQDTGEGIPRHAFGRIFEKFGQVEERKAGRKMSTGLGLAFCKLVAEAHGGRIWVESELGRGSTFFLAIPCTCALQSVEAQTGPQSAFAVGEGTLLPAAA